MHANEELQRWAGRICLLLVATFGMMGYYWSNVRFIPIMVGFAILAAVCHTPRAVSPEAGPLRRSGQHPAI
jgi:4-amino-4-deoxy-L-arabinose transferase-like glycosyltransferase